MARSSFRSFFRYGQALFAAGIAVASLASASLVGTACGDSVVSNEGPCVAQATVDPASQCDATKFSYYTCPGSRVPTLDAGSCTLSKVNGGFCCPLPTQAGNASQNGQVVDIITSKGVANATVTLTTGVSATTDSSGDYVLQVKQNTPFSMVLSGGSYAQLTEQEWMLSGDNNVGQTHFVPASLQSAVYTALKSYDNSKSTLGVGVEVTGACTDNAGAVVAVSDTNAIVVYFHGTTPDTTATSVQSGSVNPSALIYNIAPGTTPTITITPPAGCTNVPYPYTVGTLTYTGKYTLSTGSANASFFRGFVQ